MVIKYYSIEQTRSRIAEFINPIKFEDITLLNLVRSKSLSPYIWFTGYVGTIISGENKDLYEQEVGLIEPIRGYLKLDYYKYLDSFQHLLLGNNRDIWVTEIDEFADLVHGEQCATLFNRYGVVFKENILVNKRIKLPKKIKDLYESNVQPGAAILPKDIFFLASEVEKLNPQYSNESIEEDFKNVQLEKEISVLEEKLRLLMNENEQLKVKANFYHPALDQETESYAPNIVATLHINTHIMKAHQAHLEKVKLGRITEGFDRDECVEAFFKEKGITGVNERDRLKVVSNALTMGSQASLEVQNLAKQKIDQGH